jgi:hypothetical protein
MALDFLGLFLEWEFVGAGFYVGQNGVEWIGLAEVDGIGDGGGSTGGEEAKRSKRR